MNIRHEKKLKNKFNKLWNATKCHDRKSKFQWMALRCYDYLGSVQTTGRHLISVNFEVTLHECQSIFRVWLHAFLLELGITVESAKLNNWPKETHNLFWYMSLWLNKTILYSSNSSFSFFWVSFSSCSSLLQPFKKEIKCLFNSLLLN